MLRNYSQLLDTRTQATLTANPFYFYPLEPEDYIAFFKSYDGDQHYPLMAFLYLTHRCWDNCQGCFVQRIESPSAILPWEKIEQLLYDLAAGGVKSIKLAGRESTVSPYLGQTLDLCAELGLKDRNDYRWSKSAFAC